MARPSPNLDTKEINEVSFVIVPAKYVTKNPGRSAHTLAHYAFPAAAQQQKRLGLFGKARRKEEGAGAGAGAGPLLVSGT